MINTYNFRVTYISCLSQFSGRHCSCHFSTVRRQVVPPFSGLSCLKFHGKLSAERMTCFVVLLAAAVAVAAVGPATVALSFAAASRPAD